MTDRRCAFCDDLLPDENDRYCSDECEAGRRHLNDTRETERVIEDAVKQLRLAASLTAGAGPRKYIKAFMYPPWISPRARLPSNRREVAVPTEVALGNWTQAVHKGLMAAGVQGGCTIEFAGFHGWFLHIYAWDRFPAKGDYPWGKVEYQHETEWLEKCIRDSVIVSPGLTGAGPIRRWDHVRFFGAAGDAGVTA